MTASVTSLNGNVFIAEETRGHGVTTLEVPLDSNVQFHSWVATTTPEGDQEAETAPATTTGAVVSDTTAHNDSAIELNAQNEHVEWNVGILDPGEYVARFYVGNTDTTAAFELKITDLPSTTMETSTPTTTRISYVPSYDVEFTSTGVEDIEFRVTKTDSGTDRIRVDYFEYEAFLDTFVAGATVQVEVDQLGTPTSMGSDAQVNVWY